MRVLYNTHNIHCWVRNNDKQICHMLHCVCWIRSESLSEYFHLTFTHVVLESTLTQADKKLWWHQNDVKMRSTWLKKTYLSPSRFDHFLFISSSFWHNRSFLFYLGVLSDTFTLWSFDCTSGGIFVTASSKNAATFHSKKFRTPTMLINDRWSCERGERPFSAPVGKRKGEDDGRDGELKVGKSVWEQSSG